MASCRFAALTIALVYNIFIAQPGNAQSSEAIDLLQRYIQIDTSNPPGNEKSSADFFAAIFEKAGVAYEIAESSPGRANIWARLKGGNLPGVLLLHHMDVVPAVASRWQYPPFAGILKDNHIHGRGTLDNKSTGIFHLQAFLSLHTAGTPLSRDVVFLASADEEAGGKLGVGWLLKNRPDIFTGIGAVLNEGGFGHLRNGKIKFGIELTQKLPLWLKITAEGIPGHGAVPRQGSAPQRLINALTKLDKLRFKARALPVTAEYLRNIAENADPPWDIHLSAPDKIVDSPALMTALQEYDHRLYAMLTNTCSITRLTGSGKVNVVPPIATAEVDCRLLPDENPEQVLEDIRKALKEEGVTVAKTLSFGPGSSPKDNFLYRAISKNISAQYPLAQVIPKMNAGFTDSHFFREQGISAYGFTPLVLSSDDGAGVHGDNENISLDNLHMGSEMTLKILQEIVYH